MHTMNAKDYNRPDMEAAPYRYQDPPHREPAPQEPQYREPHRDASNAHIDNPRISQGGIASVQTAPTSLEAEYPGSDLITNKPGDVQSTKTNSPPRKEFAIKMAEQDYSRDNVEQQRFQERMKLANMRQDMIFQQHYNAVYLADKQRQMKEKLKVEEQQKAVRATMRQLEEEQRTKIGIAKREYNHMLQNQMREK